MDVFLLQIYKNMTIFVVIMIIAMRTRRFYFLGCLSLALLLSACGASHNTAVADNEDTSVNVGYGSVDKDDLTYAVSSVKMSENENSYTNMYDYLAGRVPGVQIGPGNTITIRGINSINSSTEPLILLDGVEISSLDDVNPYDVYSVDVLKDASSSIYGLRGANGVILITTKGAQQAKQDAAKAKKDAKAARKSSRKAEAKVSVDMK